RDRDLQELFAAHGVVRFAQVVLDRDTGRSRGFGFVELATEQDARAALAGLNGKQVGGRTLTVRAAQPREGDSRGPRQPPRKPPTSKKRKRPPALGRRLRRPRPESGEPQPKP